MDRNGEPLRGAALKSFNQKRIRELKGMTFWDFLTLSQEATKRIYRWTLLYGSALLTLILADLAKFLFLGVFSLTPGYGFFIVGVLIGSFVTTLLSLFDFLYPTQEPTDD